MSEHPHKKNRQPYGTPPNKPRVLRPGRNRPAKGYNAARKTWVGVRSPADTPTGEQS